MTQEMNELDVIVTETNEITVTDTIKAVLVAELKDVADKLELWKTDAESMTVTSKDDAELCAIKEAEIQQALKRVKGSEVLSKITDGLHKLHRRWTGFRGEFTTSLEASKKTLRAKRIAWEDEQKAIAEAERKRLQAIEDEKARKAKERQEELARKQREKEEAARKAEQETIRKAQEAENEEERKKLQAEADKNRKQAEAAAAKAAERAERAESVTTTEIRVDAPKTGSRRKTWKVKAVDQDAFLKAASTDKSLRGYIELKTTALERSKAANPMLEVAGIEFHQVSK